LKLKGARNEAVMRQQACTEALSPLAGRAAIANDVRTAADRTLNRADGTGRDLFHEAMANEDLARFMCVAGAITG